MDTGFEGQVSAKIVDARFAISGKIVKVNRSKNEKVAKGELLASLDSKILQTELDRELSDHEKIRADWDFFTQKYPNPTDDLEYTKKEKQASLNASVKQVEIAKYRLDQANLFSPVEGILYDDGGIIAGQNVTPAGSAIKIIDTSSYYFEFEIEQKDVVNFNQTKNCKVIIEGIGEFDGHTEPVFSDGKKFLVNVKLPNPQNLLIGMKGVVKM